MRQNVVCPPEQLTVSAVCPSVRGKVGYKRNDWSIEKANMKFKRYRYLNGMSFHVHGSTL